jgi:hypothetical protein
MIEEKNDYSDLLIEENLNEDLNLFLRFSKPLALEWHLEEDDMDPRLFSADVLYKKLGVDFIINKYKFKPNDEVMYPLYEEMAANLLSPLESFNLIRTLNTSQNFEKFSNINICTDNIEVSKFSQNLKDGGEGGNLSELEICDKIQ